MTKSDKNILDIQVKKVYSLNRGDLERYARAIYNTDWSSTIITWLNISIKERMVQIDQEPSLKKSMVEFSEE